MPRKDLEAKRQYDAAWRAANPGYQRRWRHKNAHWLRARKRENKAQWRLSNRHRELESERRYYALHREERNAAAQLRYAKKLQSNDWTAIRRKAGR